MLALLTLARPARAAPVSLPDSALAGHWEAEIQGDSRTFTITFDFTVKGDTLTVCDVNGDGRPDVLYGAGSGLLLLNTPRGFVEVKRNPL